jgi:serine/threonine protein kinase
LEGETEPKDSLQNGRYSLLKKLGEGGKDVVYKARDNSLDRTVYQIVVLPLHRRIDGSLSSRASSADLLRHLSFDGPNLSNLKNKLKALIREGKIAIGASVSIGHPDIAEIIGHVGFD